MDLGGEPQPAQIIVGVSGERRKASWEVRTYSDGQTGGSGRRPGARARGGTAAARLPAPPRTPACPRARPPREPVVAAAIATAAADQP
jgi:hypothetical protein